MCGNGERILTKHYEYVEDGTRMVKEEIGLAYFGARWYNADMGRFISCDPISTNLSSPQNLNKYHYCLNSPVNYTDPLGMQFVIEDPILVIYWEPAWGVFESAIPMETYPTNNPMSADIGIDARRDWSVYRDLTDSERMYQEAVDYLASLGFTEVSNFYNRKYELGKIKFIDSHNKSYRARMNFWTNKIEITRSFFQYNEDVGPPVPLSVRARASILYHEYIHATKTQPYKLYFTKKAELIATEEEMKIWGFLGINITTEREYYQVTYRVLENYIYNLNEFSDKAWREIIHTMEVLISWF